MIRVPINDHVVELDEQRLTEAHLRWINAHAPESFTSGPGRLAETVSILADLANSELGLPVVGGGVIMRAEDWTQVGGTRPNYTARSNDIVNPHDPR